VVIAALGLALAAPAPRPAPGEPKKVDAQTKAHRPTADEDLSRGGTRRGALEIGLGTVVVLTSAALIGRGAWEIVTGKQLTRDCKTFATSDVLCDRNDPASGNKIAAGLAFGLAVPLVVAAGLLLARGSRIHRDYRNYRRGQGTVTLLPSGLAIRF
jgi:hypothetical protein